MLRFLPKQSASEVLVRDPAKGRYDPASPVTAHAPKHWPFAVMCSYAYHRARLREGGSTPSATDTQTGDYASDAAVLGAAGWSRWPDFLRPELLKKLQHVGLYADVWVRDDTARTIVVVFEGTKFSSLVDWRSNFRWFLRFFPSYEDHYTVAADEVAREFFDKVYPLHKEQSGQAVKLIAAGHSLGGGLAKHFAYAFPQPFSAAGLKVSEVYAFDASPVTGWSVVPRGLRTLNAQNLRINRVFQHGEIMAYVRLFTSRLSRYSVHPSVWEYRYNFGTSRNVLRNHSMRVLSNGLMNAAGIARDTVQRSNVP